MSVNILKDSALSVWMLAVWFQMSVTGQPLPSPRAISINMHPDTNVPHVRYALMVMQFSQIMDHDLTNTPVYQGERHSVADHRSQTDRGDAQARTGKVRVRWSLSEFARVRERCKGGDPQPSICSLALTKRP